MPRTARGGGGRKIDSSSKPVGGRRAADRLRRHDPERHKKRGGETRGVALNSKQIRKGGSTHKRKPTRPFIEGAVRGRVTLEKTREQARRGRGGKNRYSQS